MPNAKLGAKVDRYSFFVRLLPPLLHIGLARRTNIAVTFIDPVDEYSEECLAPYPEDSGVAFSTDFSAVLRRKNPQALPSANDHPPTALLR
jgi:hypothetical protein